MAPYKELRCSLQLVHTRLYERYNHSSRALILSPYIRGGTWRWRNRHLRHFSSFAHLKSDNSTILCDLYCFLSTHDFTNCANTHVRASLPLLQVRTRTSAAEQAVATSTSSKPSSASSARRASTCGRCRRTMTAPFATDCAASFARRAWASSSSSTSILARSSSTRGSN